YDRVLELLAGGNAPPLHALVLYNYGELLRRQGQFEPAIARLTAAMQEAQKLPDRSIVANSRIILGEIAFDQGRFDDALQLGLRALEYAHQSGDVQAINRADEMVGATY